MDSLLNNCYTDEEDPTSSLVTGRKTSYHLSSEKNVQSLHASTTYIKVNK